MNITPLAGMRPAEILLVEDNDDDVELARIGFKKVKFAVNIHHVGDGEECMAFLRKEGKYANVPVPDLIVLDLNMPRMNGFEVLEEVNKDPNLRHFPIVVLTSSAAERDVLASYDLRCNSYVVKPLDFKSFQAAILSLADYWLTLVILPPSESRTIS